MPFSHTHIPPVGLLLLLPLGKALHLTFQGLLLLPEGLRLVQGLQKGQGQSRVGEGCQSEALPPHCLTQLVFGKRNLHTYLICPRHKALGSAPGVVGGAGIPIPTP